MKFFYAGKECYFDPRYKGIEWEKDSEKEIKQWVSEIKREREERKEWEKIYIEREKRDIYM